MMGCSADAPAVYAHVAQNAGSNLAGNSFTDVEDPAKHLVHRASTCTVNEGGTTELHLKHAA